MKPPFERPAIYLITEGRATRENFLQAREKILDIVRLAVECGASLVQVREKQLTTKL